MNAEADMFFISATTPSANWPRGIYDTVKPVDNDHLYNKIRYLWFIQKCVLMKTEGTNLLLVTISAFWRSSRWPLAF